MSNSRINDKIPSWFWNNSSMLLDLNLSYNQIRGIIPNLTMTVISLDLSWNKFSGQFPLIPSNDLYVLDVSNNALSGFISHFLGIKEPSQAKALNLENNFLSEELPDCFLNWKELELLNLGKNNFTGNFPTSIGALSSLESLHLHRNRLSGAIPCRYKIVQT